jgi:hypothetical protein
MNMPGLTLGDPDPIVRKVTGIARASSSAISNHTPELRALSGELDVTHRFHRGAINPSPVAAHNSLRHFDASLFRHTQKSGRTYWAHFSPSKIPTPSFECAAFPAPFARTDKSKELLRGTLEGRAGERFAADVGEV